MKLRTLRYQPRFEASRARLAASIRRLDDILVGLEFQIARAPEACPQVWGTLLRSVTSDPFPGAPLVVVIFTVDDDDEACVLQDLWSRDPS